MKNFRQKNFDEFPKKILMTIFYRNLFSRKWFCNHKKFSTKKFWWKFLVGKWLHPQKIFDQNILVKMFGRILFSRKWFCKHKKFSTKKFRLKFLVGTCFRGNDFATVKSLNQNISMKFFGGNLFSRKWFWNRQKFGPKNVENCW